MPLPDAIATLAVVIALVTYLLYLHYRQNPIPWPSWMTDLRGQPPPVRGLYAPRYCDECGNLLQNNACPMGHQKEEENV